MGSQCREDSRQCCGWRTKQSHICVWIQYLRNGMSLIQQMVYFFQALWGSAPSAVVFLLSSRPFFSLEIFIIFKYPVQRNVLGTVLCKITLISFVVKGVHLLYFSDYKMHWTIRYTQVLEGENRGKIFEAKNVVKCLITSFKAEILFCFDIFPQLWQIQQETTVHYRVFLQQSTVMTELSALCPSQLC